MADSWNALKDAIAVTGLLALALVGLGAFVIAGALMYGFLTMLLIGNIWHEFGSLSPIGFWPSVLLGLPNYMLLVAVAVPGAFTNNKS